MVKLAKKRGTGARALRAVFEDIMLELMYDLPARRDIKHCVISRDVVLKKTPPVYTYKEVKKTA
jgi:ATP-dependent Clp protease ATP-binding subunit ClpX